MHLQIKPLLNQVYLICYREFVPIYSLEATMRGTTVFLFFMLKQPILIGLTQSHQGLCELVNSIHFH